MNINFLITKPRPQSRPLFIYEYPNNNVVINITRDEQLRVLPIGIYEKHSVIVESDGLSFDFQSCSVPEITDRKKIYNDLTDFQVYLFGNFLNMERGRNITVSLSDKSLHFLRSTVEKVNRAWQKLLHEKGVVIL